MAAHAMERSTQLLGDMIERHPGALVSASAAMTGTVLSAIDGMNASTAAATAVATATVAIVTLVVRVLLADIRGLRARVGTLEAREDRQLTAMDAERARMAARITDLEAKLSMQDGDGR